MRHLLGCLIIIINIMSVSKGIIGFSLAVINIVLISFYFLLGYRKGKSLIQLLIELMCYSIPLYSKDIFGKNYSASSPLSLFFLFSIFTIIYIISIQFISRKKIVCYKRLNLLLLNSVILIIFTIGHACIVYTNESFSEGFNMIFFVTIILFVILFDFDKSNIDYDGILKAYCNMCVCASILLIIQATVQMFFGINIFNNPGNTDIYLFHGRLFSTLLYTDISSATIGLTIGAYILLFKDKPKILNIVFSGIIVIGTVLSSARTGFVTFLILVVIRILKDSRKNIFKSIIYLVFFYFAYLILINIMGSVREGVNESLMNDNGRIVGYIHYFKMFLKKPFLGYGFGSWNLYTTIGQSHPMPHISLLNLMNQSGIIYTILFSMLIIDIYLLTYKFKYSLEKDLIIFALVGSCMIPEIWSTKFVNIIIILPIIKYKLNIINNSTIKVSELEE